MLGAVVIGQRQVEVWIHVQPHRRRHHQVVGIAPIHPASRPVVGRGKAVRQVVVDLAATVEGHARGLLRAARDLEFVLDRAADRLLLHHVHHAADGPLAIHDRCGAAQHLDAVYRPRIEREGHRAGGHVHARAVQQLHDRALAGEAARGQRGAAVARGRIAGDAGGAGHRLAHALVAPRADGLAVEHFYAGRCLQRRQTHAAARVLGFRERHAGIGGVADNHRRQ
ncbi:hypothetical protein D3C87_1090120 [compost metagenome]